MTLERIPRGDYIQGHFVRIDDPNGEVASRNPGDLEQPVVAYPFSYEHVQEAVQAGRRAFPAWKRLGAKDRASALQRYLDLFKTRWDDLAKAMTFEIGKPLWESRLELEETASLIEYFLAEERKAPPELTVADAAPGSRGVVRFFPRGVFAVLSPAALPIFSAHHHLIPALVQGNTVVWKPSKRAPTAGQIIAEMVHDSGLPAGAFNVIQGDAELGRRLVAHPDIDGIMYTGSHEAGLKIKKQTLSDYWKVLVLDTGGKNAMVVWSDCDYRKALESALLASFLTTGQRCASTSRILVHEKLFDRFTTEFHALSKKCRIGYGFHEGANAPLLGPLVSEEAMENYLRYQGIAVREGCEELMRGKTLERDKKGYYVSPSLHIVEKPEPKSVYQTSEIYGPNVAFYRVQDTVDAVDILNLPRHGLAAAVYTGNRETYLRIADDARVGLIHWNRSTLDSAYRLPSGGLKKSGNARPMGSFSRYQCTYPQSSLELVDTSPPSDARIPLPTIEG